MKHYTTIFTALLLSAVLIFNPAVKAASVSASWTSGYGSNSARAMLINQYTVDYELYESSSSTDVYPIGNTNIYVYEINIAVKVNFNSVDAFINGYTTGSLSYSATTPGGLGLYSINTVYTPFNIQGLYSIDVSTHTPVANSSSIRVFCNNFQAQTGATEIGNMCVRYLFSSTATAGNVPDPPQYISVSVGASQTNSVLSATPDPQDQGFSTVIKNAIINALNDNDTPFEEIITLLEDIRSLNQDNYITIVAYLAENDTFNSTLYTWLTTILENDFINLLNDTDYISTVLNAARNLINEMNNRDNLYYPMFEVQLNYANRKLQTLIDLMSENPSEAASMENAIDQMESKQAAINNYTLPAAGNIIGNANNYVNQGSAGMNLLATILNKPLYILILMTVVSLAFVSYLLYGKGV